MKVDKFVEIHLGSLCCNICLIAGSGVQAMKFQKALNPWPFRSKPDAQLLFNALEIISSRLYFVWMSVPRTAADRPTYLAQKIW
ncbi:hypothetical protein AKJ16_DCAP27051 [Drosera capensis]